MGESGLKSGHREVGEVDIERLGGTKEGKGGSPCLAVKENGLDLGDHGGEEVYMERLEGTKGGRENPLASPW